MMPSLRTFRTSSHALQNLAASGLLLSVIFLIVQVGAVHASSAVSLSQTISDGVQAVDFVDSGGSSVSSPSLAFSSLSFSPSYQTATATLGSSSQKIRISNPTSDATWTVSIAATSGATATWTDGSHTYDFNDSNTDGTDDADTDSKGGRLTVDPSVSTVAGYPSDGACSPSTGITKGSSSSFREIASAVSSITLLTGGASASTYCSWDMTGIGMSQIVPPSQSSGTYTLGFTVSIL